MGGGPGYDTMSGDDGNDVIYAGAGGGRLRGNGGDDLLVGASDPSPVQIFAGSGDDTIVVGQSKTPSTGDFEIVDQDLFGYNWIVTGPGDNTVYGSPNDDFINGIAGTSTAFGRGGDDFIELAGGNAEGGEGDDIVTTFGGRALGGPGNDTVFALNGLADGGPGSDFVEGSGIVIGGTDGDVDVIDATLGGQDKCFGDADLDNFVGCEAINRANLPC